MSVATLLFPPQSTTRRPFRRSLVLAARAAFQSLQGRVLSLLARVDQASWWPLKYSTFNVQLIGIRARSWPSLSGKWQPGTGVSIAATVHFGSPNLVRPISEKSKEGYPQVGVEPTGKVSGIRDSTGT